jgi:hypothetical protein
LEIVSDGQQPCRSAARFCRHIARLSFRLRERGPPRNKPITDRSAQLPTR